MLQASVSGRSPACAKAAGGSAGRTTRSSAADAVAVLLPDQADDIARPIDDEREQSDDIPPKHAQVEIPRSNHGGEPAPEGHALSNIASQAERDVDVDRVHYPAHTGHASRGRGRRQSEFIKDLLTQDRAICAGINKGNYPRTGHVGVGTA